MTFRKWLAVFVLVAATAATAFAQGDQGRFTGTVRDSTGAFVAGATVKVKNERTGEERDVLTNQQGNFLIGNLKPSSYTIRADNRELMSTRQHASEERLAVRACAHLRTQCRASILIGGLGFGFTLRAALAELAPVHVATFAETPSAARGGPGGSGRHGRPTSS